MRLADYGAGEYRERLLARFPAYAKSLHLLNDDQDVRLYEIVSWPNTVEPAASAATAR